MTQGTRSTHTTLYRLYNDAADLLYVGIAGNPGRRFEQHAEDKPWWSEVAATKLEHFATREAACAAEVAAITTEKPQHNVMHNNGRAKPRPAGASIGQARTDRLTLADERAFGDSLVGSYFHSFEYEDGKRVAVNWQGSVVAEPAPGWYLVETFSWVSGASHNQHLVALPDMADWDFYDSAEWMNNAYETRLHRMERS